MMHNIDADERLSIGELAIELDVPMEDVQAWAAQGLIGQEIEGLFSLLDAYRQSVLTDISTLFGPVDAAQWMETPHIFLQNRTPKSILRTDEESQLFELVESMKYGGGN